MDNRFKCICGRSFKNNSGLGNHRKNCFGSGTKRDIRVSKPKNISCEKCGFTIYHTVYKKHIIHCDGRGPKNRRSRMKGKNWSSGKTFEEIYGNERAADMRHNLSVQSKHRRHNQNTRNVLREKMLERYKNGWEFKCGRCRKIHYTSKVAGDVKLDGSWELKVAIYLDSIDVIWNRNKIRFSYFNEIKQKISTYCPDFWVQDWSTYIEVKGYTTELDKCKWKQFPENLLIWGKDKIKEIESCQSLV